MEEPPGIDKLRTVIYWPFAVAYLVLVGIVAIYVLLAPQRDRFFYEITIKHFPATVGLALAAMTAVFVVMMFRVVSGDKLTFSVLGLKLEGASGPVVLWILVFLSITLAINMLWDKTYDPSKRAGTPPEAGNTQKTGSDVHGSLTTDNNPRAKTDVPKRQGDKGDHRKKN
jgi:hypothetical protein